MHEKLHELHVKVYGSIMEVEVLDTNIGKKRDLTHADQLKITYILGYGKSMLEIAKNMNHHHQTIRRFVVSGQTTRKMTKRCHLMRLSPREICKLKVEVAKTLHQSIFYNAGVPEKSCQSNETHKTTSIKVPITQFFLIHQ